ncbi:hypothetical protein ZIOFF_050066 [Zingiber officinale]|uniref:Uncharacterized protein n=1 Tax=Zingiber officinale TaxID=94328 RepID=A0A8J5FII6_ZINOF|nr:hypothetical protein ZIOFF_050066 [Zingiber officinale]
MMAHVFTTISWPLTSIVGEPPDFIRGNKRYLSQRVKGIAHLTRSVHVEKFIVATGTCVHYPMHLSVTEIYHDLVSVTEYFVAGDNGGAKMPVEILTRAQVEETLSLPNAVKFDNGNMVQYNMALTRILLLSKFSFLVLLHGFETITH